MKIVLQQYESVEALIVTGELITQSSLSRMTTPKFGNRNLSLTTNTYRSEMSNDNDQQEKPKDWHSLIKSFLMKRREISCV